ncbi:hypothetical protein NDU88_008263 [Pleurodeles waltl]|uniref:Uncharacterized protein n=1 Tax=Pleurodeles waltl TaxID=8319 RepID=A0AAV7QU56_PLEWA|nr:hypothetical protein NDU88_008263 [Pleurodeles waltl]
MERFLLLRGSLPTIGPPLPPLLVFLVLPWKRATKWRPSASGRPRSAPGADHHQSRGPLSPSGRACTAPLAPIRPNFGGGRARRERGRDCRRRSTRSAPRTARTLHRPSPDPRDARGTSRPPQSMSLNQQVDNGGQSEAFPERSKQNSLQDIGIKERLVYVKLSLKAIGAKLDVLTPYLDHVKHQMDKHED